MELLAISSGLKKKDGSDITKYDFFGKLSYDTTPEPVIKLSDAETIEQVKHRFRKYIKNG